MLHDVLKVLKPPHFVFELVLQKFLRVSEMAPGALGLFDKASVRALRLSLNFFKLCLADGLSLMLKLGVLSLGVVSKQAVYHIACCWRPTLRLVLKIHFLKIVSGVNFTLRRYLSNC